MAGLGSAAPERARDAKEAVQKARNPPRRPFSAPRRAHASDGGPGLAVAGPKADEVVLADHPARGVTHELEIGVEGADGVVELSNGDSHR